MAAFAVARSAGVGGTTPVGTHEMGRVAGVSSPSPRGRGNETRFGGWCASDGASLSPPASTSPRRWSAPGFPGGGGCSWCERAQDATSRGESRLELACIRPSVSEWQDHVRDFSSWLRQDTVITDLVLCWNSLGDRCTQNLSSALSANRTLMRLDLSLNNVGDGGAIFLGNALTQNTRLRELLLASNKVGDRGAEHLGNALVTNNALYVLDLSDNSIAEEGSMYLASGLLRNKVLRDLHLGCNQVGDAGARFLAAALKENETLTGLRLYGNRLGNASAQALATAMTENKGLQELDLADNHVGELGAEHLASALQENATLVLLEVGRNRIGDEGAKYLAEALRVNRTLRTLDLSVNDVGDVGITCLAEALVENETLLDLRLGVGDLTKKARGAAGDSVDAAGVQALAAVAAACASPHVSLPSGDESPNKASVGDAPVLAERAIGELLRRNRRNATSGSTSSSPAASEVTTCPATDHRPTASEGALVNAGVSPTRLSSVAETSQTCLPTDGSLDVGGVVVAVQAPQAWMHSPKDSLRALPSDAMSVCAAASATATAIADGATHPSSQTESWMSTPKDSLRLVGDASGCGCTDSAFHWDGAPTGRVGGGCALAERARRSFVSRSELPSPQGHHDISVPRRRSLGGVHKRSPLREFSPQRRSTPPGAASESTAIRPLSPPRQGVSMASHVAANFAAAATAAAEEAKTAAAAAAASAQRSHQRPASMSAPDVTDTPKDALRPRTEEELVKKLMSLLSAACHSPCTNREVGNDGREGGTPKSVTLSTPTWSGSANHASAGQASTVAATGTPSAPSATQGWSASAATSTSSWRSCGKDLPSTTANGVGARFSYRRGVQVANCAIAGGMSLRERARTVEGSSLQSPSSLAGNGRISSVSRQPLVEAAGGKPRRRE
eukprot:TRINITY_DN24575_c0_g1_i1.p1 TRINITY_DN24575_c0_g1~~TRINITY_DN24575_c0_g1_i1.p1  ORF type:complete len:907 (+),score=143.20 TRINITY_DN24575_c0_g1_i1:100-2820(+)